MANSTTYVSKAADDNGNICWTDQENKIWQKLYARQIEGIQDKACQEYLTGLQLLNLPTDRVPQLQDVSAVLKQKTGWQCAKVPALIGFGEFFKLLSEKKFPVATFIRDEDEFDYLQEPDIFHEIFGHCPLLTNPAFAKFTQTYGELGLKASKEDRVFLARLYWFTVEFGLMQTDDGLKIYGGGILSSPGETQYALHDDRPLRKPFDALDVLRTPYRIDIMQPVYFLIDHIDQLNDISRIDVMALIKQAKALGLHEPLFTPKIIKQAS
ncbi:phenylalanine 4-monooxygenase [Thalassotalea litorea]|uniref:phenylalanine 4-monooxygenase n=1 Tax=Thalassotalea litorea TaxID=2020715 RepID=UPI0037354FA5